MSDETTTEGPEGAGKKVEATVGTSVKAYLPDCPLMRDLRVPDGWALSERGVFYHTEKDMTDSRLICGAPVVISRKLIDLEEESEKIEVLFKREGVWKSLIAPREVFANTSKIIGLASHGLPVTTINARAMVQYLYELEIFNRLYNVFTVSSCGWKDFKGKRLFALGKSIIGTENGEVRFESQDSGTEQVVGCYRTNGTLEGWMEVIDKIFTETPQAMMAVYHALAPPLIKICGASNFCVDLAGSSSVGKTTFSRIGASVWGAVYSDQELLKSWNSTRVFGERLPSISNDLPVFLEETQLAKEEDQAKYLYMIVNGTGRGRGSLTGLREVKTWNTCLFSTGEIPLSQSTQLEGVRARTLPYWGSPFGELPVPHLLKIIESGLRQNYGLVGRQIISALLSADHAEIKERYQSHLTTLTKYLKAGVESRVASYMAVSWVAAEIFHKHYAGFFPPDFKPDEIILPVFEEIMGSFREVALWERALIATRQWVLANGPSFLKEEGGMDIPEKKYTREHFGVWRKDGTQICIFPPKLKAFFKTEGLPYEAVVREWKRKGITECTHDRTTWSVRFQGNAVWMIALNWDDK